MMINIKNAQPIIRLTAVSRRFSLESGEVEVLHDINLAINSGEMVAIMGPSGSGKSTLMNILGCLDNPSSGHYWVKGVAVKQCSVEERARLRREKFGFVFQRYHLIPALTVIENVAMPARYAHWTRAARREKAQRLLNELGLRGFENREVSRLSGGQQQRVSIARALINGANIILADEPTGALDSQTGKAVMQLLQKLHRQGHTVIVITHDPEVARYAERVVQLVDGRMVSDSHFVDKEVIYRHVNSKAVLTLAPLPCPSTEPRRWHHRCESIFDVLISAWRTLSAHRLRSSLTLLGIVIGIVSVVTLNAAGEGAKQYVMKTLSSLGGNVITLYAGKGLGDDDTAGVRSLRERDLTLLAAQPWIRTLSPQVNLNLRVRWQRADTAVNVNGVGADYLDTVSLKAVQGRSLLARDIEQHAAVVVIDENLLKKLFRRQQNPIGQTILVGNLPCRVVGVMRNTSALPANIFNLWLPWSTANSRLLGQDWFNSIAITLQDEVQTPRARIALQTLLTRLHGRQDFYLQDSSAFISSIEKTSFALTVFLSLIALVSLLVGGIGVMNIMLVSVTERTRETGIRLAVGARPRDIQWQFLTEAVLLCMIGAAIGVTLSLTMGGLFSLFVQSWQLVYSLESLLMATCCAVAVGIISGWLPAWRAARLDPAEALTRE
ncbi:ATP-binding cassette domain-containing protein [Rouxiella sp. T17]|uniref:ABC transporter permease n=1 Tax=Rouxiella sp. T17 TaxID=3085684 RepID=UPI002FC93791